MRHRLGSVNFQTAVSSILFRHFYELKKSFICCPISFVRLSVSFCDRSVVSACNYFGDFVKFVSSLKIPIGFTKIGSVCHTLHKSINELIPVISMLLIDVSTCHCV